MEQIGNHMLSVTIFAPLLGALALLFVPGRRHAWIKWISVLTVSIPVGAAVWIAVNFDRSNSSWQFVEDLSWISAFNIRYIVAIDGISVTMVLLTALLSFICIIASWNIEEWKVNRGVKGYFILMLLLQTGMTGVFCALDFFLFYVFWELVLLPMFFLIGIWGGPRREYAAIKFFLYTLFGSVLMLVVMLALYFSSKDAAGAHTFDLRWYMAHPDLFPFASAKWAFVALYIGFAIKVPVFPFHTWLPDAHVEAPTPVSVILAGVLLKMGTYGLLRISFPLFPEATRWFAPAMMAFGAINIIYGALCSMAQIRGVPRINPKTGERFLERDWKKLVAYSSVSHMGYCLVGMASGTIAGLTGTVFEMWNHGIITGALFLIVGVIYDRAHHRNLGEFGGLWSKMPYYGAVTGIMFMASLGLPGLSGFISEALCLFGGFQGSEPGAVYFGLSFAHGEHYWKILTGISALGAVLGAAYFLWSYQKVFLGTLNPKYETVEDMNLREWFMLVPLILLTVALGVWPKPILDMITGSLNVLVGQMGMPWAR